VRIVPCSIIISPQNIKHRGFSPNQIQTNPIESAIGTATKVSSRVKDWQNGNQALRWILSGFMIAEENFRTIKGYKQIPFLINALNDKETNELSETG
jgi:hypothetical protein